jgi:putative pyruvate formate lyase activating enzyme
MAFMGIHSGDTQELPSQPREPNSRVPGTNAGTGGSGYRTGEENPHVFEPNPRSNEQIPPTSELNPSSCTLCPRACGADRRAGERGVCGADGRLLVARAALHHWEEPPISGSGGSGTVFFSNCALRCVYCQNQPISSGQVGKEITVEHLAEIFCDLEDQGAHNINLVTPTQYAGHIIVAIRQARQQGMTLPIVYNTSGYETVLAIEALAGTVDIYLTDYKYASSELAKRYSNAPDYPEVALQALKAMVGQAGEYRLDENHIATGGVIIRHLMLPGQLEDSKAVIRRAFDAVGNAACYSLMNQYTPMQGSLLYPEIATTVSEKEYEALIDFALDLGITHSFMQEGGTAQESFIPAFDLTGL